MLSPQINTLLLNLKNARSSNQIKNENDSFIHVNKLTNKAGMWYEKVRYLLDYKEEHTIQRSAIERILKRKVIIEKNSEVGLPLLEELVRGGYLANDSVFESTAHEVQKIVDNYLFLRSSVITDNPKITEIVVSLAASEIGDLLYPETMEEIVVEAMYETVKDSVKTNHILTNGDLDAEIYIACRRSFLKDDAESLMYALWRRYTPSWSRNINSDEIKDISVYFETLINRILDEIEHPLGWQLIPKLKNHSIYFSLIREVIEKYGSESESILSNTELLNDHLKTLLEKKYKKEYAKTRRRAVRAIVYIFCTKLVLGLVLELPYEYFILKHFAILPLATNMLFHPLLLFAITQIKPLGKKNTDFIVKGLNDVVAGTNKHAIKVKSSSGGFLSAVFTFLYAIVFTISFGFIISLLMKLDFNYVSIILFTFFLALVSYFGLRIRHNAQEWKAHNPADEGALVSLWNIFTLPIVQMGRWLNRTFSSINIFVFIMDFMIEAPFKMMLGLSDSFISFVREKKDETY